MRAIKIFLGIIIGLIAGILGFIALGSVLSSFSIPKPAEIYRHAPEKSLIGYFLMFHPFAFMFFGTLPFVDSPGIAKRNCPFIRCWLNSEAISHW